MTCISYRQSVNSKTIKSITMLSHSGFWLKIVQSEASECSTLPRHESVNSKTIKSIAMLSHSGFWLKIVQSEASECSTLPRHVSH